MKRPAFQFYPADWMNDANLQSCSLEAQGLWIKLICIAHGCDPYGYLMLNGKPMDDQMLARRAGISAGKFRKILQELEENGVCSRKDNCVFCRRMVRDGEKHDSYIQGQTEKGLRGKDHGSNGGRPAKKNNRVAGSDPVILEPADNPSSVFSLQSSVNTEEPATSAGPLQNTTPEPEESKPPQSESKTPLIPRVPPTRAALASDPYFEAICRIAGDGLRVSAGGRVAKLANQILKSGLPVDRFEAELPQVVAKYAPFRKTLDLGTITECWIWILTPPQQTPKPAAFDRMAEALELERIAASREPLASKP